MQLLLMLGAKIRFTSPQEISKGDFFSDSRNMFKPSYTYPGVAIFVQNLSVSLFLVLFYINLISQKILQDESPAYHNYFLPPQSSC